MPIFVKIKNSFYEKILSILGCLLLLNAYSQNLKRESSELNQPLILSEADLMEYEYSMTKGNTRELTDMESMQIVVQRELLNRSNHKSLNGEATGSFPNANIINSVESIESVQYEDDLRLIPSTSSISYILPYLTPFVFYLLFFIFKNIIMGDWGTNDDKDIDVEKVILTSKQIRNKYLIQFIHRFIEALVLVGLILVFGLIEFERFIDKKIFRYDIDDTTVSWVIVFIWILFQDFIILGVKQFTSWYNDNSKL